MIAKETDMDELDLFRTLIVSSQRIVFFTGAGISTESGIPDFRSPSTGIWNEIVPIEFSAFIESEEKRTEAWRRKFDGSNQLATAEPNNGHKAIAKFIKSGQATVVITQNVDSLHQRSGVSDDRIIELHGNAKYARCLNCQMRYELTDLQIEFEKLGRISPCQRCGGIIKIATISFGQNMPQDEMRHAEEATTVCDLFVVVGSSLTVYPAAGFPQLAKQMGANLVIVNREETSLDSIADLVIHRDISPTLSFVAGIN